MCRTHVINFLSCGHQEKENTEIFPCPGPNCRPEVISHELDRFCISCLFDHFSARNPPGMARRRRSELMGPERESSISTHEAGGAENAQDRNNTNEFSEPLTYEDSTWLKSTEHDVHSAIWIWLLTPSADDAPDPIPDPTFEDLLMYLHIRKEMMAQMILQSEARITNKTRASASLAAILTLVPAPKEPSCSICKADFEELGDDGELKESPVRLPCKHEFGSRCLEMWAGAWEPGTEYVVSCPMCRRVFTILPRAEEPVSPRWIRLLRETWSL